jgi:cytochrome c oxidase assembly factor CtaG
LFVSVPASAFLGLALYSSSQPLYAHYVESLGRSAALTDQHVAGALMWIAPNAFAFIVSLLLVADWGRVERRLGTLADREAAPQEAT